MIALEYGLESKKITFHYEIRMYLCTGGETHVQRSVIGQHKMSMLPLVPKW